MSFPLYTLGFSLLVSCYSLPLPFSLSRFLSPLSFLIPSLSLARSVELLFTSSTLPFPPPVWLDPRRAPRRWRQSCISLVLIFFTSADTVARKSAPDVPWILFDRQVAGSIKGGFGDRWVRWHHGTTLVNELRAAERRCCGLWTYSYMLYVHVTWLLQFVQHKSHELTQGCGPADPLRPRDKQNVWDAAEGKSEGYKAVCCSVHLFFPPRKFHSIPAIFFFCKNILLSLADRKK